MGIYTSTSPFVSTPNQGRARNSALLPEATLRSERILEVASQEMEIATNYYPLEGEYYRRRKSGRQCTCQRESIDRHIEEKEEAGVSLSDFLVSLNEGLTEEDFCPICFGTGLVGGYERTGTANITLDTTLNPTLDKINVIQQPPYYFKPTNKWGTITWSIVVPKYFQDVLNVAIRWKEEPDQWTLKVDGSTITKDSFLDEKGNSIDIEFSMKDSTNKEAGIYAIFIQLSVSSSYSIKCDIPRKIIDYTGEFNIFDAPESNVTINFDNTVKNLTTRDLLVDDEGYIWRIVRVERGNPMSVDIFKTCESRLVRRFEKYYQIPSKKIISKYYNEENPTDSLYTWVL